MQAHCPRDTTTYVQSVYICVAIRDGLVPYICRAGDSSLAIVELHPTEECNIHNFILLLTTFTGGKTCYCTLMGDACLQLLTKF